jgi:ferredoxin-thioredoxin reductase catalytic subunit
MKIVTNPDTEYVAEVRQKLKENAGYCPCAILKSADTKCMCKEFREMNAGMCHCGLYIKVQD